MPPSSQPEGPQQVAAWLTSSLRHRSTLVSQTESISWGMVHTTRPAPPHSTPTHPSFTEVFSLYIYLIILLGGGRGSFWHQLSKKNSVFQFSLGRGKRREYLTEHIASFPRRLELELDSGAHEGGKQKGRRGSNKMKRTDLRPAFCIAY